MMNNPTNNPNNFPAFHSGEDESRWNYLEEESIHIGDGELRSIELISPPVERNPLGYTSENLLTVGAGSTEELSGRIFHLASRNTYKARLGMEFNVNYLREMWKWKYKNEKEVNALENSINEEELLEGSQISQPNDDHFKLALLLIIPMLESQADIDDRVTSRTTKLLLEMLSNPKTILSGEMLTPLDGLEDLLCDWVRKKKGDEFESLGVSTLVALACARGNVSSFFKTIKLIKEVEKDLLLPVRNILDNLKTMKEKIGEPSTITGNNFLFSFPYNDLLVNQVEGPPDSNRRNSNAPDEIIKHFIATDGSYLYMTGPKGKGIAKIGSGIAKSETVKGWVYAKNDSIEAGHLIYANELLIIRGQILDKLNEKIPNVLEPPEFILGKYLNTETLEEDGVIFGDPSLFLDTIAVTLGLASDGHLIYYLRGQYPPEKPNDKGGDPPKVQIYLDVWKLEKREKGRMFVVSTQPRILLTRKEEFVGLNVGRNEITTTGESSLRSRSIRISTLLSGFMGQPNPTPSPTTTISDDTIENYPTSLGLPFKSLLHAPMYTNGNYVTILLQNFSTQRSFGPFAPTNPPKLFGWQLHIGLLGSKVIYSKQNVSFVNENCSFYRGAVIGQMGGTYDGTNHVIWLNNGDYVDAWKCPGFYPPEYQKQNLPLFALNENEDPNRGNNISSRSVLDRLLAHVSAISLHYPNARGEKMGFDSEALFLVSQTLKTFLVEFTEEELISFFYVLKSLVLGLKEEDFHNGDLTNAVLDLENVSLSMLSLGSIYENLKESTREVIEDLVSEIFLKIFTILNVGQESRIDFFSQLYNMIDGTEIIKKEIKTNFFRFKFNVHFLKKIRNLTLQKFTTHLNSPGLILPHSWNYILGFSIIGRILKDSNDECQIIFDNIEKDQSLLTKIHQDFPKVTVLIKYVNSVVNNLLRSNVIQPRDEVSMYDEEFLQTTREVLKASCVLLEKVSQFLSNKQNPTYDFLYCVDLILKSTILAQSTPQILAVLNIENFPSFKVSTSLAEDVIKLSIILSHINGRLFEQSDDNRLGEDWANVIERPSIWDLSRIVETCHPLREAHRGKETVTIPHAKRLYLKFNPLCASQYEYDRLTITTGNGKKIVEFGGNYYGVGTRGSFIPGWTKELLRVDGDTVNISFEMKSGREHATPEKAFWGYQITIVPYFHNGDYEKLNGEERRLNIPRTNLLVTKLSLASNGALNVLLNSLYDGDLKVSKPETDSGLIFKIPFIQSLKWSNNVELASSIYTSEEIGNLRKIAGLTGPKIRESLRSIVRPLEVENLFLRSCLKFTLNSANEKDEILTGQMILKKIEDGDQVLTKDTIKAIFRYIDIVLRSLLDLADIEQRFIAEVGEIVEGTKNIDEAFFNDQHFKDTGTQLENLAIICDLNFNSTNPKQTLNDINAIVNVFVDDKSIPQLKKTEELVKEFHLKSSHLLSTTVRSDLGASKLCLDSKQAIQRIKQVYKFLSVHFSFQLATMNSFIGAINIRQKRAQSRLVALDYTHKCILAANPNSHLLNIAGLILQNGCELWTVTCSGLEKDLIESCGKIVKTMVEIISKNPLLYRDTVALMCVVAYKKSEEDIIVKSGLLSLLDKLCAFEMEDFKKGQEILPTQTDELSINHRASSIAWAAFQVMAARCASWDFEKNLVNPNWDTFPDLPVQISLNVTNHLSRATKLAELSCGEVEESHPNYRSCGRSLTEAIQDVLGLLDTLRDKRLGKAILKQSPCISRLLILLQDPRLSPRLVLTILRLLHTALPLVEKLDPEDLTHLMDKKKPIGTNAYNHVVNLLLIKLADFLVCGTSGNSGGIAKTVEERSEREESQKMAVYIYRRQGEGVGDLQRLLNETPMEYKPSRSNEELEREFVRAEGKVQFYIDEKNTAKRKATKLAQIGFIVSTSTVLRTNSNTGISSPSPRPGPDSTSAKYCKERNLHLSSYDPPRPFLSGQVAEGLASEIIQLLRALLSTSQKPPESDVNSSPGSIDASARSSCESFSTNSGSLENISQLPAQPSLVTVQSLKSSSVWSSSVEQVLCTSLKALGKIAGIVNPSLVSLETYSHAARLAIAALSVLGGFTETIRPGSTAWIVESSDPSFVTCGEIPFEFESETLPIEVIVKSVSEKSGIAHVEISPPTGSKKSMRKGSLIFPSESFQVPLRRLTHDPNGKILPQISISSQKEIAGFLKSLLLPSASSSCPLKKSLPHLTGFIGNNSEPRTIAHGMTFARLLAEVRTRGTHVLSLWFKKKEFLDIFLGLGSQTDLSGNSSSSSNQEKNSSVEVCEIMESLKYLAKESIPSHQIESLENQVSRLRLLYRDCTKPPRLGVRSQSKLYCGPMSKFKWDVTKTFPPVRNCVFSEEMSCVGFFGDPSTGAGNPRGMFLYTTEKFTEPFYYEIEIGELGESSSDSSSAFSFGFAPMALDRGALTPVWNYPVGSAFFHSSGRIVHYSGTSLLSWRSIRLNTLDEPGALKSKDVVGIGWENLEPQSNGGPNNRRRNNTTTAPTPMLRGSQTPGPIRIRNSNTGAIGRNVAQSSVNLLGNGILSLPKGRVYFTINGIRIDQNLEQVDSSLFAALHIQKTNVQLLTNFGTREFKYPPAEKLRAQHGINKILDQSTTHDLQRRVSDSIHDLNSQLGTLDISALEEFFDDEDEGDDEGILVDHDGIIHMAFEEGSEDGNFAPTEASAESRRAVGGDSSGSLSAGDEDDSDDTEIALIIQTAANAQISGSLDEHDEDPPTPPPPPPFAVPPLTHQEQLAIAPPPLTRLPSSLNEQNLEKFITAKFKAESKEYQWKDSLDQFLPPGSSLDIRTFSGPSTFQCSCVENYFANDLDFLILEEKETCRPSPISTAQPTGQRSGESEDVHDLLVNAWEGRVFPIIRRRFRNESERRDGLNQIRGALILGMIDIARQTVEFLYEESGGLPRDLHFPTIEEVKAETAKFTIERVNPGMSVFIMNLEKSEGGSIVPKYAVPGMLRTFGLTGEVLEVDTALELVLVETYVETEGVLLRFWYPLNGLEKPQNQKKTTLNSSTVNMFKLHSNLLYLEDSLTHIFCRDAYLQILENYAAESISESKSNLKLDSNQKEIPKTLFSPFAHLPIFKDLDLDNLHLLSQHYFSRFPVNGNLLKWNLRFGIPSLKQMSDLGNPSVLFYADTTKLTRELQSAISRAVKQGEDYLNDLSNQILAIFELAPEKFPSYELNLDAEKSDIEVYLPDSSFVTISFKTGSKSVNNLTHSPNLHIYGFESGKIKKRPMMCYPVHYIPPPHHTNHSYAGSNVKKAQLFSQILLPTDRIAISLTSEQLSGVTLNVQGIPAQFPLALLFCQELIKFLRNSSHEQISSQPSTNLVCSLINLLTRTQFPPLVKEWIFIILAESLMLHKDGRKDFLTTSQTAVAQQLFVELVLIGEKEMKLELNRMFSQERPATTGTLNPPGTSRTQRTFLNIRNPRLINSASPKPIKGSNPLFPALSSYAQALMELCLAFAQVTEVSYSALQYFSESPAISVAISPIGSPGRKESTLTLGSSSVPGSPQGTIVKRNAGRGRGKSLKKPQLISPGILKQQPIENLVNDLKIKEVNWFQDSLTAVLALKHITWGETSPESIKVVNDLQIEAATKMTESNPYERLIVILGAPPQRNGLSIDMTLVRATKEFGGIYGGTEFEIFNDKDVVLELGSSSNSTAAVELLKKSKTWYSLDDYILFQNLDVFKAKQNLTTENPQATILLSNYLRKKVSTGKRGDQLTPKGEEILIEIFTSCFMSNEIHGEGGIEDSETIYLSPTQMLNNAEGNLMEKFITAVKPEKSVNANAFLLEILKKFGVFKSSNNKKSNTTEKDCEDSCDVMSQKGKEAEGKEIWTLTQTGFLQWTTILAKENPSTLWLGILASGFDFRLDKVYFSPLEFSVPQWNKEEDENLVNFIDSIAAKLRIPPTAINLQEIYLTESDMNLERYCKLRDIKISHIRLRAGILQTLNSIVGSNLLPMIPLHIGTSYHTTASLISDSRHLFFYNTKEEYIMKILKFSSQRANEIPPPEITMDPLLSIERSNEDKSHLTQLSSAVRQMMEIPSPLLCVPPSTGGDPPLPLVVRLLGEEVQGLSGSFRHFLSDIIHEFDSPSMQLLVKCPSASAGENKDSMIIRPGPLAFGEEIFLNFLGLLMGISFRADVPLSLCFMNHTWRSLLRIQEDSIENDLKNADVLTHTFLNSIEKISTPEEFDMMLADNDWPKFSFQSLDENAIVNLCPAGSTLGLSWSTKEQYIRLVKRFREREFSSENRMRHILSGLSTLVPLPPLFTLFTPSHLELRLTGSTEINLPLLKAHTHYQVGVGENDPHVLYFWAALGSFEPEDLRKFVKFACNQDRLPVSCPCQGQAKGSVQIHVPPFPMKISSIDIPHGATSDQIDKRLLRVETCLFLIRLPPYSNLQITRQQILYAINSREDPLSG